MTYFSDSEQGPLARTLEEVNERAWAGLCTLMSGRIDDGSFGYGYPLMCDDEGKGSYGTNEHSFLLGLRAEIPALEEWPFSVDNPPPTLTILDMIEFCWRAIAKPIKRDYHPFFGHYHLAFDTKEGRLSFREDVNRILARNGLAYELTEEGSIVRLAPVELRETLGQATFHTGDSLLDEMLETVLTLKR